MVCNLEVQTKRIEENKKLQKISKIAEKRRVATKKALLKQFKTKKYGVEIWG